MRRLKTALATDRIMLMEILSKSSISSQELHPTEYKSCISFLDMHQIPREGKVPREAETHEIVTKSSQITKC